MVEKKEMEKHLINNPNCKTSIIKQINNCLRIIEINDTIL